MPGKIAVATTGISLGRWKNQGDMFFLIAPLSGFIISEEVPRNTENTSWKYPVNQQIDFRVIFSAAHFLSLESPYSSSRDHQSCFKSIRNRCGDIGYLTLVYLTLL